MSTIQALKEELQRIQRMQELCIDDRGIIQKHYKYKYIELINTATHLKHSIEWLEALEK